MIILYRYGATVQTHHYLVGSGLIATYNVTATATVVTGGSQRTLLLLGVGR